MYVGLTLLRLVPCWKLKNERDEPNGPYFFWGEFTWYYFLIATKNNYEGLTQYALVPLGPTLFRLLPFIQ